MAVDNTHTKYLKGADKKVWENYKSAYEAQKKFENFLGGLKMPELKEGEEYDIPLANERKKSNKKPKKKAKK